jgi:hypothetical protein
MNLLLTVHQADWHGPRNAIHKTLVNLFYNVYAEITNLIHWRWRNSNFNYKAIFIK